jgi:hypothetical protein
MAMTTRTIETTITFRQPFTLSSIDGMQPAGTYRLVTDEEEIPGLSFLALRRTATMLQLPALSASPSSSYRVVPVDPAELQKALDADGGASSPR